MAAACVFVQWKGDERPDRYQRLLLLLLLFVFRRMPLASLPYLKVVVVVVAGVFPKMGVVYSSIVCRDERKQNNKRREREGMRQVRFFWETGT